MYARWLTDTRKRSLFFVIGLLFIDGVWPCGKQQRIQHVFFYVLIDHRKYLILNSDDIIIKYMAPL